MNKRFFVDLALIITLQSVANAQQYSGTIVGKFSLIFQIDRIRPIMFFYLFLKKFQNMNKKVALNDLEASYQIRQKYSNIS